MNRRILVAVVACAVIGGVHGTAHAQIRVEGGPLVGYYHADGRAASTDGPDAPGNYSAMAVGVQLMVKFPHRLGVRTDAMFAPSSPNQTTNPGGWQPQLPGRVTSSTLLVTVDAVRDEDATLWIGAGRGLIHHGGEGFATSGDPTNVASVVALGLERSLTKSFALSAGVSAMLYRYGGIFGTIGGPPHYDGSPTSDGYYAIRWQRDALFYAALTWRSQ
jgi:hypothetical protein